MRTRRSLMLIILIAATGACKLVRKDDDRKPLARVYEHYLYQEDIVGLTTGMPAEDSAAFIDNYIYNWGKEQLLIYLAEYNLRAEQKEFEQLVTQYRNDLIKFAYLEKYVSENIDTTIQTTEVKAYYEEHSSDFELKENIVTCDFYTFPNTSPDLDKAKYWWRSPTEKNLERFYDYASIFASAKSVGDTNWLPFDILAKEIPLPTYNQQQLLNQNKRLTLEDSLKTYFVVFKKYKIKDDVSPLSYVTGTIENIILNKRKLELIKKMEKNLVEDAFNKQDFEIY
jgi:hypothetical protein